jgi:hypothetical protein
MKQWVKRRLLPMPWFASIFHSLCQSVCSLYSSKVTVHLTKCHSWDTFRFDDYCTSVRMGTQTGPQVIECLWLQTKIRNMESLSGACQEMNILGTFICLYQADDTWLLPIGSRCRLGSMSSTGVPKTETMDLSPLGPSRKVSVFILFGSLPTTSWPSDLPTCRWGRYTTMKPDHG